MRSQKAVMTMSLFLVGICSFQTSWTGNTRIATSVAISKPVMTCHLSTWRGHDLAFCLKSQDRPSKVVHPAVIRMRERMHCVDTRAATKYCNLW